MFNLKKLDVWQEAIELPKSVAAAEKQSKMPGGLRRSLLEPKD
jgi:hypothetical protein